MKSGETTDYSTHIFGGDADGRAGLDDARLDDDTAHDRVALHEHVVRHHAQLAREHGRVLQKRSLVSLSLSLLIIDTHRPFEGAHLLADFAKSTAQRSAIGGFLSPPEIKFSE